MESHDPHILNLQQRFDDYVQENIKKYETDIRTAILKAVNDWPTQEKLLLRDIVSDKLLRHKNDPDHLMDKLMILKKSIDTSSVETMEEVLKFLKSECINDVLNCVLLIQKQYDYILFDGLKKYKQFEELRNLFIESLTILTAGNIQILNKSRTETMVSFLDWQFGHETLLSVLNCIVCSSANETVVMLMAQSELMNHIENLLNVDGLPELVLLKICDLIKIIVTFDKVNSECSFQSYYISYDVPDDVINGLVFQLKEYKENKNIVKKILNTLTTIITNNSLCKHFLHTGGLLVNSEILQTYTEEEEIVFHSFRLLKTITQSDKVRDEVMQHITPPTVVSTVRKFYKRGCWLIYNIASRNHELREEFLKNGILDTIRNMLVWVNNCHFECKTALIQLGYRLDYIEKLFEETETAVTNLENCTISEVDNGEN